MHSPFAIFVKNRKLMMSDYLVHINVAPYVAEFMYHHFGNPVRLVKDSPEARLLKTYLERMPEGARPDVGVGNNLRIAVPWFKEKDPRVYCWLSPMSKAALGECFESVFLRNMWVELLQMPEVRCRISTMIYAYMERHGISEEHWECIRQKYYRLRKQYFKEKGVKL